MATLRPTIRKQYADKSGNAIIQIALSHHGKTAYISTDIKVKVENWLKDRQYKGAGKNETNAKVLEIVNILQERLCKIEYVDAKNVHQLKDALMIEKKQGYHKLSECFKAYVEKLSDNSKKSYHTALMVLQEYSKNHDINIESIDCSYVRQFEKWLNNLTPYRTQRQKSTENKYYGVWRVVNTGNVKKERYSQTSINTFLAHLKAVINYCITEGWVKYDIHPFAKTEIRTAKRRENIISPEDLCKIKNCNVSNKRYKLTHDMFMLSFYLAGANIADILRIDFSNDFVSFERKKIQSRSQGKTTVTMPILPCAREIIDRYIGEDGKLKVFNKDVNNVSSELNYCIKCICVQAGVKPNNVTFTSARKAFATIGTNLGISDNYLDYLMGHSMAKKRGMMNPYSVMDVSLAGKILETIVTMADHPEKIKEIFEERLTKIISRIGE